MSFRAMLGLGLSVVLGFFVWQAMAAILAALTIVFWWALGIGTGTILFVGVAYWQREQDSRLRFVDGQAPLQWVKLSGGRRVLVDINSTVGGIIDIDPVHGVIERVPSAGWELQQQHNAIVQTTRSLAAIIPGDAAQVRTHGAIAAPKLGEAVTKMLTKVQPVVPQSVPAIVPPIVVPPVVQRLPVTGQQMIASPQKTRLAIGEIVGTDEIAYWDVLRNPFVRTHGTTGEGKTELAKLFVAQAIKYEWEVTVLDTRQFKDWGIFRNHATVIDARDPTIALAAIQREVARYEQRDNVLGQHQAADIAELQRITGKAYKRRLLVVEEVQSHHINAEFAGGKAYRQAFWMALHKLTKDARATGIHGLYIDQIPSDWAKGVRYNSASICFHLPDYGGRVAGYIDANKLEKYHCHYDGKIIKAGYLTESQILATIGNAPAKRVFSGQNDTQKGTEQPVRSPERTNEQPKEPELTDIQRQVAEYIVTNPDGGVRPMARALGIAPSYASVLREEYLKRPPTLPTEATA